MPIGCSGTLIGSAEYQSKSPTNQTNVERLYRAYLGRFPATSESNYWRGLLDSTIVMWTGEFGRLPVVDDRARVVGIVTLSSLVLRGRDREEALETAKEVSRRSARRASAA